MNADETSNEARARRPNSDAFKDFIRSGWAESSRVPSGAIAAAPFAAQRRARLSSSFRDTRIVVPAGNLTPRSNDVDYRFRPHSDFAYLTGLGADHEPGAVLVMTPSGDGHDTVLYLPEPVDRSGEGFYSDPRHGEFWIGPRPSLADFATMTGMATAPIGDLPGGIRLSAQPTR